MPSWLLYPDVAGALGGHTIMDTHVHPPVVTRLHYIIDDWHGDELLESTPCFIITARLANRLNNADLTGYDLDGAEVTLSDMGAQILGSTALPVFVWLKVTGKPGTDDFGLTSDASLVVSGRALDALRAGNIGNCDIEERS